MSEVEKDCKREEDIIDKLYPLGTREREIIDYSRSDHPSKDVHPLLITGFKILMGVTVIALISLASRFIFYEA